jgi:phosphatidylinositol alpha-1,6-mannosyltransferase
VHPPKVWVVSPEVHLRGGTERCLSEQLQRWRERFDLTIYSISADSGVTGETLVRHVPTLVGPHLLRWTCWYLANTCIRRWDRKVSGPDVVFSPGINCPDADAMIVHILFAKHWADAGKWERRNLVKLRSAPRALHRITFWRLLRALEGRHYRGPASVAAPSHMDAHELERRYERPPGSVVVIPHGVDASRFSPSARVARRGAARQRLSIEDRRVVLVVGNDIYKKGIDVAVDAVAHLPEDVVLAVAGHVDRSELTARATAMGVSDRLHLWSHVSDVLDYYAAADVLVAPSREDAFGLPPLEAMAAGVPVIVSRRTGLAENLADGRDALILADPEDAQMLARRVEEVLGDPGLTERLSAEGPWTAERMSWDTNAEATAAFLEHEASTPRALVLSADPAGTGGIERSTRSLLGTLHDLIGPERVGLLSVWRRASMVDLPCRVLPHGRRVRKQPPGPVPLTTKIGFALAALRAARRWRRRLVVVACHPHLAPVAWMCGLVSGAPFAIWCHGYETWGSLRWSMVAALRRADVVFAPSEYSARATERAAGLPSGSIRVIPHCLPPHVDLASLDGLERSPSVVLTVARLNPDNRYKGVDVLLTAWAEVRRKVPSATLTVAGDGPDRARLEDIARSLSIDNSVTFAGGVDDEELARLYRSAAVFALPANTTTNPPRGEGFGIVFVEAAAAGLPVVAGDAGPAPEVVDETLGVLVNPGDASAVADAIVRLLADDDLRRGMGEAGRERVGNRYSYELFRSRIASLLDDLTHLRSDIRNDLRSGLWATLTSQSSG